MLTPLNEAKRRSKRRITIYSEISRRYRRYKTTRTSVLKKVRTMPTQARSFFQPTNSKKNRKCHKRNETKLKGSLLMNSSYEARCFAIPPKRYPNQRNSDIPTFCRLLFILHSLRVWHVAKDSWAFHNEIKWRVISLLSLLSLTLSLTHTSCHIPASE